MKRFLVKLIEFYQAYLSFDHGLLSFLAPGGACKYSISCSEYTKQMIEQYGVWQGLKLGLQRLWGCR